jgi:hypothetical protein
VVLQLELPRSGVRKAASESWSHVHEHAVDPGSSLEIPIFVYNFADRPASGEVFVEGLPEGARLEPVRREVSVAPMERSRLIFDYRVPDRPSDPKAGIGWIRLRGEFGPLGRPALAFRLALR